jgi:Membrane domain of glycerophosphoryl diester phosphodiesterase
MRAREILGEAWALYQAHWRHLVTIAFVIYLLLAALALLLTLLLGPVGALSGALAAFAGMFWLQGALVGAVEDVRDGRADLSVRETLERVRPHLNRLSFAALGLLILFVAVAVLVALGFVLLVIPGIVLLAAFLVFLVRWSLLVPVIVLEGRTVFGALDRSQELVRGHSWAVARVILATVAILIGVGAAVSLSLSPFPNWVESTAGSLVAGSLTAPFTALAWTLMYLHLRPAPAPIEASPVLEA